MQPRYIVSIPEPCHEDWEQMSPTERGRFCASCQKVVVDYSQMSDAQILAAIKKTGASGLGCGRLSAQQQDRILLPAPDNGRRLPRFTARVAASLLGLQLLAQDAGAQTKSDSAQVQPPGGPQQQPAQPLRLSGYLRDETTLRPIAGASLQLEKLGFTACTEADGKFTFLLPADSDTGRTEKIVRIETDTGGNRGLSLREVPPFKLAAYIGQDTLVLWGCQCQILQRVTITAAPPRPQHVNGGAMVITEVKPKRSGWFGLRKQSRR